MQDTAVKPINVQPGLLSVPNEEDGVSGFAAHSKTFNLMQTMFEEPPEKRPKEDDEEAPKELSKEEDPAWFQSHDKWWQFAPVSLFFFGHENPIRLFCIKIITHRYFENTILFLILANSLLLGIYNYLDPENTTTRNKVITGTEPVFIAAFTLECVLKVIGMGFFYDTGSYLDDSWNWLDFMVVISSLLTEIPQLKSISSMRTLRLMRPLRSLTTLPSMRLLIATLLASVAQLGGVMVLAVFFFLIFAILGVSLWSGAIYKRCYVTDTPVDGDWVVDIEDTSLCDDNVRTCAANRYCGSLAVASRDPNM